MVADAKSMDHWGWGAIIVMEVGYGRGKFIQLRLSRKGLTLVLALHTFAVSLQVVLACKSTPASFTLEWSFIGVD